MPRKKGAPPPRKRSASRDRPAGTSPRRRPVPRAPVSSHLSRDLFETLELLGDAFEEAVEHVLSRPGAPALRAGPRLPLPLSRLLSGYVGWQIELRGEPKGAPSPPWGVLYLLASPTPVGRPAPRTGETPVQGVRWKEVHALELASAGARLLLLAWPQDPSDLPRFRDLAEEVRAEFRPDQD